MDIGTTTTIAFATTSFTAELIGLNVNDITRPDIDVTHMGSTIYREFLPGKLADGGMVEMEIGFDPDTQPPILEDPEVITITFPLPDGMATAAKVVFTGYVNSWSAGLPLEDKMTATISIKVDGITAPVWSVAAA